jgi:hypothetical protein
MTWEDNIHAVLDTLGDFIKVKLSTSDYLTKHTWGIMRFLEESNTP